MAAESSGLSAGAVPSATGVTVEASVPTVESSTLVASAEIPHPEQQAALFDLTAVSPPPLLPAMYAPTGEHVIIRLATPLECVILDTEDLSLCRQPAMLAYA